MRETKKQPDILICMSDQHGADYLGWRDPVLETPFLDEMKAEGTLFENAYTPCPLCVPARMSFMSSLLPERTGVFDNSFTLADTIPCFTHSLVEAGYETVLVGRMHFTGQDQRHGFTKRLAPDITPVGWQKPFRALIKERGKTVRAFSSGGATQLVGAGASIVNEYDRMVTEQAIRYLLEPHEKPQFILVGSFGPHFPYIADEELYRKYLDRVQLPAFFRPDALPKGLRDHPVLKHKIKSEELTEDAAKACLAAYYANIEEMDTRIGTLRKAFREYTERNGHSALFGYISDHGDSAGERRMYGKQTYYDRSAKIPMIFTGDEIANNRLITTPVSLLDVGPTILSFADAVPMDGVDGSSLEELMRKEAEGNANMQENRIVVSEMMDEADGQIYASVMLRSGPYKLVLYHNMEDRMTLVNVEEDPLETENLIDSLPEVRDCFLRYIRENIDFEIGRAHV